jgi:hypothetical protein
MIFRKRYLSLRTLKFLDLSAKFWGEMYEHLTPSQKKILKRKQNELGVCNVSLLYRPNEIIDIPQEISKLTKLELIYLIDVKVSIETIKKIEKLLPNVIVVPSSKDLEILKE